MTIFDDNFWIILTIEKAVLETFDIGDTYFDQRWKNVRIVWIYPCYFFNIAVLFFWLYTRKQTVLFCTVATVLLALYY